MPRPVSIRASYRDDGAFLLRLEAAVMKDERQTIEWRQETARMSRQLAMRLLEADARKNMGAADPDSSESGDRRGRKSSSSKTASVR